MTRLDIIGADPNARGKHFNVNSSWHMYAITGILKDSGQLNFYQFRDGLPDDLYESGAWQPLLGGRIRFSINIADPDASEAFQGVVGASTLLRVARVRELTEGVDVEFRFPTPEEAAQVCMELNAAIVCMQLVKPMRHTILGWRAVR